MLVGVVITSLLVIAGLICIFYEHILDFIDSIYCTIKCTKITNKLDMVIRNGDNND